MELEIGKSYVTASGNVVTVVSEDGRIPYSFIAECSTHVNFSYTRDGKYCISANHPMNIVKEYFEETGDSNQLKLTFNV